MIGSLFTFSLYSSNHGSILLGFRDNDDVFLS